ncbi:MAG: uroporphyrinogen-III C-methyltransferase [Pseudomonadota bacterium]
MSEMEQKPDETAVAEVSEESVDTPETAAQEMAAAERPRSGRGLAWFAVLLALGTLGGGYSLWQEVDKQRAAVLHENQVLHSRLEQLTTQQQEMAARLAQDSGALEQLRSDTRLLNDALEKMNERLGRDRHAWVLAEADYLLQMANRRLLLERDVAGAIAAMTAADQRLAFLNDPLLTRVRAQLSEELQALRALPVLDVDGITLELGALSKGVDNLVLAGTPREEQDTTAAAEQPSGWRGLVQTVWSDIRSLVVIRRHDAGSLPLTTPDQRLLLRQNLRLKLETARLSLLRGHGQAYRAALQEADAWVERFYDAASPATVGMREALGRLAAIDVAPPLPAIDQSLHALREISARLERSARS